MKYPDCIYCAEYDKDYNCCWCDHIGLCDHPETTEPEKKPITTLTDEEYNALQEAMKEIKENELPF